MLARLKIVRLCSILGPWLAALPVSAQDDLELKRGETLFFAAGCDNCHNRKDGPALAGGVELKTPFGTFRTPNISPDPQYGIGRWSDADFLRALREGVSPTGDNYYPAFPYTTYTNMTDADILAIRHWIMAKGAPVAEPSKPHDLGFPFNQRWAMTFWKWAFFQEGPLRPDPTKLKEWNRGAYLVEAVSHCGECHSPRNFAGAVSRSRWLGGNTEGPDGDKVPNITPDKETGIGTWSVGDIAYVLESGLLPNGDVVGGTMAAMVNQGTDRLSADDRKAIAAYLISLPPISNPAAKATKAE